MLKLLLILILLFYLVYRVGAFLLKMLFIGASQQQRQQYRSSGEYTQTEQKRPAGGNVQIDYVPNNKKDKSGKDGFEGGQYVDFEEVKD